MRVAIVGGTGDQGFGLALRLARAGEEVVIGSRDAARGETAAARVREALDGDARVSGAENAESVRDAHTVFVAVPYAGQAEIYRSIGDDVPDGVPVCDMTSPLATAVGGRPWQVIRPWHGSAAEQAAALLRRGVPLVAGFHTVSAEVLNDLDRDVDGDALLCGDDDDAKVAVGALAEKIPNLRWVDCGRLAAARLLEPMTAVLVAVNRRYRVRDAGFRVTGIPPRA